MWVWLRDWPIVPVLMMLVIHMAVCLLALAVQADWGSGGEITLGGWRS